MAAAVQQQQDSATPARFSAFSWELAVAVLIYGLVTGIGLGQPVLVVAVVAPYGLMLLLARPHWIVPFYVPLVFADLLSIATRYHGVPPLARFAGILLLVAVLGYRIVIHRQWIPRDTMSWWMVAYAVLLAAGLLYADNTAVVSDNLVEFARSFITYLIILCTVTSRDRLRVVLWGMLAIAVALALITLYQTASGNFDNDFGGLAQSRVSEIAGESDAPRPGGTLNDANYYGQWLLVALPVGLFLIFRATHPLQLVLGVFSSAVITAAVVFTYSRGDAVALFAMIVLIVIYKRPKPALIAAGLVAMAVAMPFLPGNYAERLLTILDTAQGDQQTIYSEYSIRGRMLAAQAAIDMFLDHPILGVGRENYVEHQLEYAARTGLAVRARAIPPHILYLEVAAEHGLVGIFVFAGILLTAVGAVFDARRRFLRVKDERHAELAVWLGISLAGYLVTSIFLHGAYLYVLWLLIAVIVAMRQIAVAAEARYLRGAEAEALQV